MPRATSRKPSRRRARSGWPPALPALEQRHLDLLGLGLVAAAVFFAFVVYLGWDGGRAGEGAVEGLRLALGAVHHLVPAVLMGAGALLVLRPVLPAARPIRAGVVCLIAGLALGLAAGTLGLGPGGRRAELWDPAWVKPRGGMVGEALYWASSTLLGDLGASVLAVFLFLAAGLLLTGATIAGVITATHESVSTTGRRLRDQTTEVRDRVARRRDATEELSELERDGAARVTAAPAESAFWSGEERFPELYDGAGALEAELEAA